VPLAPNQPFHLVRTGPSTWPKCAVFSLGVLLYDILAGALPSLKAHQELQSPAVVLALRGPEGTAVAEARATTLEDLTRMLEETLGDILSRACRIDPARRYQSVRELAQALEDYLESTVNAGADE